MPKVLFERKRDNPREVSLSPEEVSRLKHHAARLNWSQQEIMRSAIFERLNKLDEQEVFALQAKRARRGGAAAMGHVPTVDGAPFDPANSVFSLPSLPGGLVSSAKVKEEKLPPRLVAALDTWTPYVGEAERGSLDRDIRLQRVKDDLRQRSATDAQIDVVLEKLQERLDARDATTPAKISKAPDGITISGDVD